MPCFTATDGSRQQFVDQTTESLEYLAHRNGFDSFASLFAASRPLLLDHAGIRWYIALDPRRRWFVWNDQGRVLTGERATEKETPADRA